MPLAVLYEPVIVACRAVLLGRIARQTEATWELMRRFTLQHDALRLRRGVMLYSDMTHRLARGPYAGRPASGDAVLNEMYFRLDAAVTHLLLDEFQDTSLEQWQVLSPFAEEVAAYADGERELLVVGDTKQAIYGWRGGCVELFEVVEAMVPLEGHETLAVSHRSSPVVLDAVNDVFSRIAGCPTLTGDEDDAAAAERWGRGFKPHQPAKPDLPGYVRFEVSGDTAPEPTEGDGDGDDDAEDAATAPATAHEIFVAEQIAELYHAAPGRSVGVLVRTNAMVQRLIYQLRCARIPASGEGGNSLDESPAVAAILSALMLADHPADTASGFHVRNSPLAAVLVDDLHASDRVIARSVRAALVHDGYAPTLARWAEAMAEHCDAQGVARLTRLVELAEAWDAEGGGGGVGTLRPSRFVDHVEATRVEEPGEAAVRVMTIHKSKGLEFDAVVLPELDKPLNNTFDVLIDRPDPTGPIEAVFRHPDKHVRPMSPQLEGAYHQRRQRQRQEDLCGLYVAMTRAKQALYLIAKPAGTPRLAKLSFAGVLRDTLGDPDEGYAVGEPHWAGPAAERVGAGAEPAVLRVSLPHDGRPRRGLASVSPSSLHGRGGVQAGDLLRLEVGEAMQRGTSLHHALETVRYVEDLDDAAVAALPGKLREAIGHAAVRAALSPRWADEALWRERRFVVEDGGRLLQGSFDRVAVRQDAAGRAVEAVVIDFKSDRVEAAELDERVEHYRPQLEAYRRAAAALLRLPTERVGGELVFLALGVVATVDAV